MLEEEIAYYRQNLAEWMAKYPGKFALIRGNVLEGTFDTMEAALDEGSRRFGLAPYLIRQIGAASEEISIPALTLGILRADPSLPNPATRADA